MKKIQAERGFLTSDRRFLLPLILYNNIRLNTILLIQTYKPVNLNFYNFIFIQSQIITTQTT